MALSKVVNLKEVGVELTLEYEYYRVDWVSASEGKRFAQVMAELTDQVQQEFYYRLALFLDLML